MSVEYISVKIAPRGEIKEGVRAKEKAKQRKPAKMEAKKKRRRGTVIGGKWRETEPGLAGCSCCV